MTCQLYQPELSAYLDGELPATRAARLEAHLRVCPHCLGELTEINGISAYIRSASQELHVSQGFDQRILHAVGHYQTTGRHAKSRNYMRQLVIATIMLLSLLGLTQYFLLDRPPSSQPVRAEAARASVAPLLPSAPLADKE